MTEAGHVDFAIPAVHDGDGLVPLITVDEQGASFLKKIARQEQAAL
jgi:hypothetical protein